MEILQSIDAALFHFINGTLANPLTDKFMPFITERNHWFIFYVLIWLFLFFYGGKKGKVSAVLIIILILISDQISENIFKQYFQRIRPCNALENVHLLINCSGSFSFPSNHAVNNFAAATLFTYFYPRMKIFLFTGASIIALSRVMCGVHYPFDIAAGAIFGILFGMLVIYLWKMFNKVFKILT